VGEPNLSQAEQVSQGGEPTVARGRPVWAPRLRLPPAKIGKSKAGVLSGPILDPCSRLTEPRKIQLQRMQSTTDLLSTHSTLVCHKTLYSNTHNPAPQ
jgi:hypothetical protein